MLNTFPLFILYRPSKNSRKGIQQSNLFSAVNTRVRGTAEIRRSPVVFRKGWKNSLLDGWNCIKVHSRAAALGSEVNSNIRIGLHVYLQHHEAIDIRPDCEVQFFLGWLNFPVENTTFPFHSERYVFLCVTLFSWRRLSVTPVVKHWPLNSISCYRSLVPMMMIKELDPCEAILVAQFSGNVL